MSAVTVRLFETWGQQIGGGLLVARTLWTLTPKATLS